MTLSDFILLSASGKKSLVKLLGILIAKRVEGGGMVYLFQVESLYVEIYCNPVTRVIEEYRAFTGAAALAPYLGSIAIDDIL